jgi:NADH-quinone oxidoreductase subunit M
VEHDPVIAWIDSVLLLLLVGLPLLGAFFVALMPEDDRVTLRYVGMGAKLAAAAVALRGLWLLLDTPSIAAPLALPGITFPLSVELNVANLPAVLGICASAPMALRAGAPRIARWVKAYVLLLLLIESLALGAVLVDQALASIILLNGLLVPTLLLLGLYGGEHKGSLGFRFGVAQLLADALALAALIAVNVDATDDNKALLAGALMLAGAVRLGLFPLSSWFVGLVEEAPVALVAIIGGVIGPCASHLLYRGVAVVDGEVHPLLLSAVLVVGLAGAAVAAVIAFVGHDLMRWVGATLVLLGSLTIIGIAVGTPGAVARALWLLPVGGVSCAAFAFAVDGIERRYLSRDSRQLPGMAQQIGGLWRVLLGGGLGAVGLPLLGVGALAPAAELEIARAPAWAAAGFVGHLGFFVAGGLVLAQLGIAVALITHLRRTLAAPRPGMRAPAPLKTAQTARLWVPIIVVLLGGLLGRDRAEATAEVLATTLEPRPTAGLTRPGEAP